MHGLPGSRLLLRRIVRLSTGSEAHHPAFPREQGSAEGVRGVGVEGAEPAELVPGGGEVAESGLRDDQGDPGLDEREVESERGPGGPGRLGPSARLGVEDGQPTGVVGTVRVDRGGAAEEADRLVPPTRGPGQRGRPFQEPLVVSSRAIPARKASRASAVRPRIQRRCALASSAGRRRAESARAESSRTEARRARSVAPPCRHRSRAAWNRAIPRSRSASTPDGPPARPGQTRSTGSAPAPRPGRASGAAARRRSSAGCGDRSSPCERRLWSRAGACGSRRNCRRPGGRGGRARGCGRPWSRGRRGSLRGSARPARPAPGGGAGRGRTCSRGRRRWRRSSGWRASARPGRRPGSGRPRSASTKTATNSSSGSPGRKSPSLWPARRTRSAPWRWH